MTKRITKTYRVMKALSSFPKEQFIQVHFIWRKLDLSKNTIGNRLCWLVNRKLVEKVKENGYKDKHPYCTASYRLSKNGRVYMKRRAEREKFERMNNAA